MKKTGTITQLLGFIFFLSGFSSLIYQVVWQRLLTVHYGVGSISITLIISIYMFGLGLGALFGGYFAEKIKKRIKLYFFIELLLGFFGLISPYFLDLLGKYTAGANYLVTLACLFIFLSFPTLLMGMTLPLLTKIFNSILHDFIASVSFLYFINTLGAAFGAVFSSYIAISFFGLDGAIYIAVVINFILAALILYTGRKNDLNQEAYQAVKQESAAQNTFISTAYLLVFTTGFLAIGYEIVWFRIISVLIKDSPYGFSSMLFVYLVGIALGSYAMNRFLLRSSIDKKALFFRMQFFIGAYVLLVFTAYYFLTKHTALSIVTTWSFSQPVHPPFLSYNAPSLHSLRDVLQYIFTAGDVIFWPLFFIFIPTMFMGASFPLITALALSRQDREGATVGAVYFFNVVGNVLGGLITGFILLKYVGSEVTLLTFSLIGVSFLLFTDRRLLKRNIVTVIVIFAFSLALFPKRNQLFDIIYSPPGQGYAAYMEEGVEGTVMTYVKGDRVVNYIHGVPHGGRPGYIFYVQALMSACYKSQPRNVLVIGYGTGSIIEALLKIDTIETVTLVEISSTLIDNLSKIKIFKDMLADKRVNIIMDDGRRFLLRNHEKFDLVCIDPLNSFTAYSNNLYSKQFFELVSRNLADEGTFFVWFDDPMIVPRTLATVFRYITSCTLKWPPNSFCIVSNTPLTKNKACEERLVDSYPEKDRQELIQWYNAVEYNDDDRNNIMEKTRGYPINEDFKPMCEYFLGKTIRQGFSLAK